jgi:hypothetical protein
MSQPTGRYHAPGQGPLPGQPGYGEPIANPGMPQPYGIPQQYGQPQPYGQPQQYGYGRPPARPGRGTVIAAAVIQIVQASLFVLGAVGILLIAHLVNSAGDEINRRADSDVSGITDLISLWAAVAGLLLLAFAVVMIVLAALAIRGRRWAAITSVLVQALAAVAGLTGLSQSETSPVIGLIFLLAAVAVVVLFLLPDSTAYFAARTAVRR